MPSRTSSSPEYYFHDPRLSMTTAGRLTVRTVTYVGYASVAAAVGVALFSDLAWLFWLGVLGTLFILERIVHRGEGDRAIYDLSRSGKVNLADSLSSSSFAALEEAYDRSRLIGTNFYLECARGLLKREEMKDALVRLDVPPEELIHKLESFIEEMRGKEDVSRATRESKAGKLVFAAFEDASSRRSRFIDPMDLFSGLFQVGDPYATRLFSTFSIEPDDMHKAFLAERGKRHFGLFDRVPQAIGGMLSGGERRVRHRVVNRAWTSRPTPTLDAYSLDLTAYASSGGVGLLVGHKEEYSRLVDTLSRPTRPNALLVGEPGVGKETLVSHLAFNLIKDRVPEAIFDKRLVMLDISRMTAGASPEELQRRAQTIANEIVIAGNVILYIPEIHNLVQTSGTAYLSAADALLPIIMSDAFPTIGGTYPREFKQHIESRTDFLGAFEVIRVEEISAEDAETILVYEGAILEAHYKVTISFGAIKSAVKVAKRYFKGRKLPASASELLKEAAAFAASRKEKKVGTEIVVAVAETKTNVPIHETTEAEAETLLNLEKVIHERMVDQEEAVKAVADALRAYRSGLSRKGGPIASFLFVGPTGVGKTELAKTISRIQFGSEDAMVRFDMTEYQDKQSFFRFVGSPDGKTSGALTEAVLQKPYSLVLLDEFEKAYPDILGLFLQVLDDGRLTDNLSRTVDFTNTIVIATSNAHSDIINEALRSGQSMTEIAEYLKRRLTDVFKPELLNRFSKTVVFKDLAPEHIRSIVGFQLKEIAKTLLEERGVVFWAEGEALNELGRLGFDPAFGARPLRRVIDEKVRALLSDKILKNEIPRGSKVTLSWSGEFRIGVE